MKLSWNKYPKLKPYILLLPALTVLLILFMGGVVSALGQSLGYFPLLGLEEFTLEYFKEVWTSAQFLAGLRYSLYISIVSSLIATVVGVFLAYQLLKLPGDNKLLSILYKLPIIVPYLAAILMVFLIYTQSGILARVFYRLGLIEQMRQFPAIVFDRSGVGIISVYLWKQIPFVTLVVFTILKNINRSWEEVAANLGANSWQIFWNIYLPLALPSIGSAYIIIFAFSFGTFEVPYLLGPTFPRALPVLAYQRYSSIDLLQRPYAMVIAVTLAGVSFGLIFIYKKLIDLSKL